MWLMHVYSNLNIYQYLHVSCKLLCNRLCNNFPVLFYCIVSQELLLFNPPLLLPILLSILFIPCFPFFIVDVAFLTMLNVIFFFYCQFFVSYFQTLWTLAFLQLSLLCSLVFLWLKTVGLQELEILVYVFLGN